MCTRRRCIHLEQRRRLLLTHSHYVVDDVADDLEVRDAEDPDGGREAVVEAAVADVGLEAKTRVVVDVDVGQRVAGVVGLREAFLTTSVKLHVVESGEPCCHACQPREMPACAHRQTHKRISQKHKTSILFVSARVRVCGSEGENTNE